MNNNQEDKDIFTVVEPTEIYQSSSSNCGVSTLLSHSQKKPLKKISIMITPNCRNGSFSFCNTIMLPYVSTEEDIKTERKNENNNNNVNKNIIEDYKKKIFYTEVNKKNEKNFINQLYNEKFNNPQSLQKEKIKNEENKEIKNRNHKKMKSLLIQYSNTNYNNDTNKIDINFNKVKTINSNIIYNMNNKNEYENKKDDNKNEEEMEENMEIRRSVRIRGNTTKNLDLNKNENTLRKSKKFKIKNGILNHKNKLKNKTSTKRQTSLEKSKKMKSSKNTFYVHLNKKLDKINNGDNSKKIIKKNKIEKGKEEEDEDEENEDMKKFERIKKTKNYTRIEELRKDYKINKLNDLISKKKTYYIMPKFNKLKENMNKEKNKNLNIDINNNNKEIIKNENKKKSKKLLGKIKSEKIPDLKIKKNFEKNIEKIKDKNDNSNNLNYIKKFPISSKIINIYDDKGYESKKNKSQSFLKIIKKQRNSVVLDRPIMKKYTNINSSQKEINIKKKINSDLIDFEKALENNKNKKMQFNLFSQDKFTNTEFIDSDYLKYTLNCMELILDINKEKQNRLSNKINFNFPKSKKKNIKKKIALFDLDETLVHCTGDIRTTKEKYQNIIKIKLPGRQEIQVGINCRPYWKQTLKLIKKNYYIVAYTASHQAYADAVLDFMDPKKKYFKYRLYRNNCSLIDVDGSKFYVKDLEILNGNYDLKDIIIIDNSVLSFAFHLHNGIPIVPYYNEDKDGSLYVVGLYLMHIFHEDDLREANKKHINLDSFLEEARRRKEENTSIEENEEESSDILENGKENNNENNQINPSKKESKNLIMRSSVRDNKKFFNQNSILNIKNMPFTKFSARLQRKKSLDFSNYKLKSLSKLLNMYYELNEQSPKNINNFNLRKSNIFRFNGIKKKILNDDNDDIPEIQNENKSEDNEPHTVLIEHKNDNEHDEIECKSAHDYLIKDHNNIKEKKRNTIYNEESMFKKGFIREISDKIKNNHSKTSKYIRNQLKFICSNFYNTFKI